MNETARPKFERYGATTICSRRPNNTTWNLTGNGMKNNNKERNMSNRYGQKYTISSIFRSCQSCDPFPLNSDSKMASLWGINVEVWTVIERGLQTGNFWFTCLRATRSLGAAHTVLQGPTGLPFSTGLQGPTGLPFPTGLQGPTCLPGPPGSSIQDPRPRTGLRDNRPTSLRSTGHSWASKPAELWSIGHQAYRVLA